ncbi:MAG: putative addiction module antidote protein [Proteobacteria bacterium]|nr:putative addiction module antidote protein [Pseudomonadota bacterium]
MSKATPVKTTLWDPAVYIKTERDAAAYLSAAWEDGDPKLIAEVLADIARSRSLTAVAKKTGFKRKSLRWALSHNRSLKFTTVLEVMRALGLKLKVAA